MKDIDAGDGFNEFKDKPDADGNGDTDNGAGDHTGSFLNFFGSPAEERYLNPPINNKTKATRPARGMIDCRMFLKISSKH